MYCSKFYDKQESFSQLEIANKTIATQNLLELINEYSKIERYKINTQKFLAFLYTNNEKSEKLRQQSHSPLQRKE